jgi:hypothetical protein
VEWAVWISNFRKSHITLKITVKSQITKRLNSSYKKSH